MCMTKPLTKEELDFVLHNFKIEAGGLYRRWKTGRWTLVKNKATGSRGYVQVSIGKKKIFYHRLIWILSTKEDIQTGFVFDHLDGNTLHNSIHNLRIVTPRQNQQNRKSHRDGRLVGCSYDKKTGKWVASINVNGDDVWLGTFATEEAHRQYCLALENIDKRETNGQFVNLINELNPFYKKIGGRGYRFNNRAEKWEGYIQIKGRTVSLNYFSAEEDAKNQRRLALENIDKYESPKQFRKYLENLLRSTNIA